MTLVDITKEQKTQTILLKGIHVNLAGLRFDVQNAILRNERKPEPTLFMGWYYIP